MTQALRSSLRFILDLTTDLAVTLRNRWRWFLRGVVEGEPTLTVGVDVLPIFDNMTGVGWYVWNLLQELDRRDDGIRFNLYGPVFLGPEDRTAPAVPGSRAMRLRLHRLPSDFVLPLGLTLGFLRTVVEPVLRTLDGNDLFFVPSLARHQSRVPVGRTRVTTVHDLGFHLRPDLINPDHLLFLRQSLPDALFRSERLIALSDATANALEEHLGISRRRIHRIHEGLDPLFLDARDEDEAVVEGRYLLFVSTLEPRKNVLAVIHAFELVKRWGYPGRLVLVGDWGWQPEPIRQRIFSSPACDAILHLGYVPNSKLPALYRNADALLYPSWLEGFGLPVLEAMASGTPVVTSGQSAMPEVGGPAAVYVNPESPHGIASAVAALLEDPSHRLRLIERGLERARRFSWDAAAAATVATLRQAAGQDCDDPDEHRV